MHPPRAQLTGQEPVNLEGILCVLAIHHAEGGERNVVLLEQASGRHDLGVRVRAAFRISVTVVQLLGTVAAQADEKVVLLEE